MVGGEVHTCRRAEILAHIVGYGQLAGLHALASARGPRSGAHHPAIAAVVVVGVVVRGLRDDAGVWVVAWTLMSELQGSGP
jgi:hypothetical protein